MICAVKQATKKCSNPRLLLHQRGCKRTASKLKHRGAQYSLAGGCVLRSGVRMIQA